MRTKLCFRSVILSAALLAGALVSPAEADIDYTMGYLSLPGKVQFIEKDLTTAVEEQQVENLKFGSAVFRLGITLPQPVGPFQAAVEGGFGLPFSTPNLDHRQLVRNAPLGASRDDTNYGDITRWQVMSVPLYFVLRYAPPVDSVSLGGQLAIGPVLLGVFQEQIESIYAVDGSLDREITTRTQFNSMAFGMEAALGLEVPATQDLTVRLLGGVIWLSQVSYTTLDKDYFPGPDPPESEVYGEDTTLPGLELGGLGFLIRASVSIGI